MNIEQMIGKMMVKVDRTDSTLLFVDNTGVSYLFYHEQDCCEDVYIEDICGELDDLLNVPILEAEESSNSGMNEYDGSYTWTFYKFATIKGNVTIRWYGESNGFYSESVTLEITKKG